MVFKNAIKFLGLLVITLSVGSLLAHLFVANYGARDLTKYKLDNFYPTGQVSHHGKLWGTVRALEGLQPYSDPRDNFSISSEHNRYIYAKIYGGYDRIRSSICDLVTVSRLLNATLIIPEIQESLQSKGISAKFKSFSYLFNEDQFIAALSNDVLILKRLPKQLKDAKKKYKFPTFSPKSSASASFYIREVLPKLKQSKVVGLLITNGGCLKSILPPSMDEYQRLRCRVAFHALQFRPEIQALGNQILERLRASGGPFLAYHPGLIRETLAYHGCAELFQDVHTELIQYKRRQLIKRGIVHENLSIDSMTRKRNGSCPLMPEEVGLLFRAMGYPSNTVIYLAGAETFGGQRILTPLRAMYTNLVDRSSMCSKEELFRLFGPESELPSNLPFPPPVKSEKELIEEWQKAGPRPRPLPPPPARPLYRHEKEGWYGWINEADEEPNPSPVDLRNQAHRLLLDALDYHVAVEADAFFPGFHNDGSGWPDFSSLVMGQRLYQMASGITYRPDRKTLADLFDTIHDHIYHPKRNWTTAVWEHLNGSLGVDGLIAQALLSKPRSFLSHPLPECSCRVPKSSDIPSLARGTGGELLYGGEEECPRWMKHDLETVLPKFSSKDDVTTENYLPEAEPDAIELESDESRTDAAKLGEPDEEMDPND